MGFVHLLTKGKDSAFFFLVPQRILTAYLYYTRARVMRVGALL